MDWLAPLISFFAQEHPAVVHVSLGGVVLLPIAMLLAFREKERDTWARASFFLAVFALLSSILAILSGYFWARQMALITPGAMLAHPQNSGQLLQRMLRYHEILGVLGLMLGGLCLWFLGRAIKHPPHRGVGFPALLLGCLWLGVWGFAGRVGGVMVHGNDSLAEAAAKQQAAQKKDPEAELPIRALDYQGLEPAQEKPFLSKDHGKRWARIWVTASGIDDYKAGKALPTGAYAVMSTVEDQQGKPGFEPGPLYMREVKADGTSDLLVYWARIPEANRKEFGGADSVYWRSPEAKLQDCMQCHGKR